jgi:acetyltransferase-like isoleucine patch superfamily enzyme
MIKFLKKHFSPEFKTRIRRLLYLPGNLRDALFLRSKGIFWHHSMRFWGLPHIQKRRRSEISFGKNFIACSKRDFNSIGVFQKCIFKTNHPNAKIIIEDNVGISGSTIAATVSVTIKRDVLVGSGCLITDSDAHPLSYKDRLNGGIIRAKPVVIGEGVFLGARSIVLKGITIGRGSVIGAGSVVVKDIPENCLAAGNPARVLREIN